MDLTHRRITLLGTGLALVVALAGLLAFLPARSAAAAVGIENLWPASPTPTTPTTSDPGSVELGIRVRVAVAGSVTGIRFYKGAGNSGTHTGTLWTAKGGPLASGTFTHETASGWQTLSFASPVAVTANTTYVASYHAPAGHYADDQGYFASQYTSSDLSVSANGGVYAYGSTPAFPTGTWHQSNYWVDLLFRPATGTPPTTTTQLPTTQPTTTQPTTTQPTTTQPTTTQPTTTVPAPPTVTGTWPRADDTGASGSLTTVQGDVVLGDPGTVYQNMRVNGTIAVTACGVTLRNVEVDTGEAYTGDSTPDLFAIWLQVPANCGTTLDHVSVLVDPSSSLPYATEGVRDAYGSAMTVTASRIVGTQLGMTVGPGTVSDSYILLAPTMRGDHNEDILEDGITGLTLEHNTFLNPNGQTSTLSLFTEFGNNNDVTVTDNLLAGGGYTCYCGDGATDNAGSPARANDVSFIDNVFWRLYFPNVGEYGAGRAYNPAGGGQWTGNVFMNADGTVTTEQVPQPPIDQ